MPKALDWVIDRYPKQKNLVRKLWEENENFAEVCEHFVWMSEAASYNPDKKKVEAYASLRDKLKVELDDFLGVSK